MEVEVSTCHNVFVVEILRVFSFPKRQVVLVEVNFDTSVFKEGASVFVGFHVIKACVSRCDESRWVDGFTFTNFVRRCDSHFVDVEVKGFLIPCISETKAAADSCFVRLITFELVKVHFTNVVVGRACKTFFTIDVFTVLITVVLDRLNVRASMWVVWIFRVWTVRVFTTWRVDLYRVRHDAVLVTDVKTVSVLVSRIVVKDTTNNGEVRRIVCFIEVSVVFRCFCVCKSHCQDVLVFVEAYDVVSVVTFFGFCSVKVDLVS